MRLEGWGGRTRLLVGALALGCTGPAINHEYARQLEICAGPHLGIFTGDQVGLLQSDLRLDGRMTVTFSTSAGDIRVSGYIDAEGVVTGSHEGVEVVGTYDFDACEGWGTWWSDMLDAEGEWTLARDG